MIRTSYLRVYQPPASIEGLPGPETWLSEEEQDIVATRTSHRWLLRADLPSLDPSPSLTEGAFVRRVDGHVLVCPWRTRLRMLAGLLAFRGSVPDEVAEAFVDEADARRAASQLARLETTHPEVRNHIIHANWHVPLRWFAAFDPAQRILTEDKQGLRIRYESPLSEAKVRLSRALEILESSWIDDAVTGAVRELGEWVDDFAEEGILELDYASVAGIFTDEDLLEDQSSAVVWSCLDALEVGDVVRAGQAFAELTAKWSDVRAFEVIN